MLSITYLGMNMKIQKVPVMLTVENSRLSRVRLFSLTLQSYDCYTL